MIHLGWSARTREEVHVRANTEESSCTSKRTSCRHHKETEAKVSNPFEMDSVEFQLKTMTVRIKLTDQDHDRWCHVSSQARDV